MLELCPGYWQRGKLYREMKKLLFTAACIAPEPHGNVLGDGVGVLVEIIGSELELQGPAGSLLRGRVAHSVDIIP